VRLYCSRITIVGGDDAVAAAWLRNPNTATRAPGLSSGSRPSTVSCRS
jgi:hypothetical protein